MTGTGYGNQPLGSGTNLIVGLTHSARNVIVILAMEKDHGNPAAFQCLPGGSVPKVKTTKQDTAQTDRVVEKLR